MTLFYRIYFMEDFEAFLLLFFMATLTPKDTKTDPPKADIPATAPVCGSKVSPVSGLIGSDSV